MAASGQVGRSRGNLKNSLSDRRNVLKDKRLCLFKTLISKAGHDDHLVDHLVEGFDLTGLLPESHVFNKRMKPAAMSCDELRRVSEMTCSSIKVTIYLTLQQLQVKVYQQYKH